MVTSSGGGSESGEVRRAGAKHPLAGSTIQVRTWTVDGLGGGYT